MDKESVPFQTGLLVDKPGNIIECYIYDSGHAVAQWLRHCATNRKVAGSIPGGVIGIFH
jgi:hypothetical protein